MTAQDPPRTTDPQRPDGTWAVPDDLNRRPLDGAVRTLAAVPWSEARRMIETGKIRVGGEIVTDTGRAVRAGDRIELHMAAPRPRIAEERRLASDLLVFADAHVVVVRKPAGISTVLFGDEEPGTPSLDALVREVLAKRDRSRGRAELGVVQRLDKPTTGLLVFARTFAAKKHLGQQLRVHSMERRYVALAHGEVRSGTVRSYLVEDRGDRRRGSARDGRQEGQLAVTHIERLEALAGATLVACRLETGRTHQIRIHLSEGGHPLLGENVYTRGFAGPLLPAPRVMLHAAVLGFEHPADGRRMRFEDPPPRDFELVLARLRR